MKIGLFLETFVFIVSGLVGCFGFEKHWLPDLEWQTANNWAAARLPELDDRVLFPLEMRHAVGIAESSDLRLAEIDLPKEGILALARDGKLEISDSSKSAKVATWLKEGHFFWADPDNWNTKSEAAPHLERVPCQSDDVVLPSSNHTFSVLLPMRNVKVRSIRLANEKNPLTRWQWNELRDHREFLRGRFSVGYSLYGCTNCKCQDGSQDYREEICAIERPRCGYQKCEYPLQVEGHCCDYCGGRISLPQKTSLTIIQALTSDAFDGYENKLSWYVRRTWDDSVEVLVKEKGVYSELASQSAIIHLRKVLEENGFTVLKMETAGPPLKNSRLSVVLAPLLGALFLVFVLFLLGFRFYGYSSNEILKGCTDVWMSVREGVQADNSKSGKRFGFARFENAPEGNVEIAGRAAMAIVEEGREGDEEETEEEVEEGTSAGGRFENPLYSSKRSKPKSKGKLIDDDIPLALSTLKDQVGNDTEEVDLDIEE